ncbi:MAG: glycosyltransferase family 2 protein [Chloroflexi bacterium]|nr:glycosyltransferase family 2 protein [Anaerolineaceae bacterium]NMB89606.1 glycosyltransferase family 2 protein [Chloroflexota bacterium]
MVEPVLAPTRPTVDIVVPLFNEEQALGAFHALLCAAIDPLPYIFKIYYVNDGSTDGTQAALERLSAGDRRVQVVELSRNFGHQAALTAGMDLAQGDYVITMDGDGQHPPAMIPEMLRLAESGYDLVLTQRLEQADISAFKRWTSSFFYRLINRLGDTDIQPGGADFRLLTRRVMQSLCGMREYHRFLRGMVAWMGFRSVILPFQPPQRLAGESKYSLRKMVRLGTNAIFSFSLVPLYIGLSVGAFFLLMALVEAIYVLNFWVRGDTQTLAPGWSSLMFMLLLVGGTLMIILGFIGVYIGYIFQEVKRRPIYLVRHMQGGGPDGAGEGNPTAGEETNE